MAGPLLQRWHRWYFSRPRRFLYKDISVTVAPGVFPPQLTFSTRTLLDFLETVPVSGKNFLELGCGCGVIACRSAKRGANVTASDINPVAVETLQESANKNSVEIEVVLSDLFEKLQQQTFDMIAINPPYYPKNPGKIEDNAWFCGEDFGYFKKLFAQLPRFLSQNCQAFMVLSDDCGLGSIEKIASENEIAFSPVFQKKNFSGVETIFSVSLSTHADGVRY